MTLSPRDQWSTTVLHPCLEDGTCVIIDRAVLSCRYDLMTSDIVIINPVNFAIKKKQKSKCTNYREHLRQCGIMQTSKTVFIL